MGASDMEHHPFGCLVTGERLSGKGCTKYSDTVSEIPGRVVRGIRNRIPRYGEMTWKYPSPPISAQEVSDCELHELSGGSTGVVEITPPIVKHPVHRHFRRKREEGSSFCEKTFFWMVYIQHYDEY